MLPSKDILSILESDTEPTPAKVDALNEIAFKYFVSNQLEENEALFQKYIYSWHIFHVRGIPFDLWSDIAADALALLKKMLESRNFQYENNSKYAELMHKLRARV